MRLYGQHTLILLPKVDGIGGLFYWPNQSKGRARRGRIYKVNYLTFIPVANFQFFSKCFSV